MFDLDAYIDGIAIKEVSPSDDLVNTTIQKCDEILRQKKKENKLVMGLKKAALVAVPAAVLLTIGIAIGSRFFSTFSPQTSACFTVDINPSVCVNVDDNCIVTGLNPQNDDARKLLGKLDCVGLNAAEAIYKIVEQAKTDGYINAENQYVLVGCFGVNNEDETLGSLQKKLEGNFGSILNLLIVSGTLEDKREADSLLVSAGLLKLSKIAEGIELGGKEKVQDIVNIMQNRYRAPILSVKENTGGLFLNWSKLNFSEIGYSGDVTISIVSADTATDIQNYNAQVLKTFSFSSDGDQATNWTLTPQNCGISPGTVKFYGITISYGSEKKLVSNIISAKMPQTANETSSTVSSAAQSPVEPMVTGSISGIAVVLKWQKETSDALAGYKIVASKTNPNPKYPEDGYIKFITDENATSVKLYEGDGGLKGGQSYYFSVTYLYNNGSTVSLNAVQLTVPQKAASEQPASFASSTLSGTMSGTTANFSWSGISDSRLSGYKVVCSFTNSSPSYPNDGYVYWITDGRTSCSVDMTKLPGYAPGAACYCVITAVYNDGTKKTGNVVALTMPADAPPSPEYASTTLSGFMDGTVARLSWNGISDARLDGYKVVKSITSTNPKYPDDGYVYWITDGSTSCSVDLSDVPSGTKVYFAITVLYNGHSVARYSNTVTLTVP